MRTRWQRSLLLLFLPLACARWPVASLPQPVHSPNGHVEFRLLTDASGLKYWITERGRPLIELSPLVITLDGTAISEDVKLTRLIRYQLDERYPWRGVHSIATNRCNGANFFLTHTATGSSYKLEVRAYDDGVAFRYVVSASDKPRVPDEATKFIIPPGSTVWHHNLEGHYEAVHKKSPVEELQAGEWCAPPMTFKLPRGGYASITEAALMNYSGMALQADGQRGFTVALGHKHPVSYPFRLRYSNDVMRVSKPAAMAGTITSPWRVVMIGRDLNELVNSDIVHNLCPSPDKTLFPKGMQTHWIKPGRAVWRYLDGGRNTVEEVKDFSRWAGELGFEYQVVEGFWSRWSDEQIKEVVEFSRKQGVELWLWRHSRELRTPEEREQFFSKLERLGVVGAKIDFFDHEHKDVIDLYYTLLAGAAKHHILINFHGANKPTGEARTWPNELIREGVRGMEASRLQQRARHNTTLPFTRYLAGHADYTPVLFGARRGDTTWPHQIASAAVFDEPLLTYGAHPTNLLANPAVDMIKSVPSTWDETYVLPQSNIGELAAFARRHGNDWFLAILNGPEQRALKIPLNFLGAGSYRAMIVRDKQGEPAAVQMENRSANRSEALDVQMNGGGGFIARFTPDK